MALHTDTPRPHVHVVIKAVSEQGQRLHIRKATLRDWRSEFARHLRALGGRGECNAALRPRRDGTSKAGRHLPGEPAGRVHVHA